MGLIVELLLWFIIEFVFWGISFWTGHFLTVIFTIGQWKLAPVGTDKIERTETKFIVTAVIGAIFWIGIGIALTIAL